MDISGMQQVQTNAIFRKVQRIYLVAQSFLLYTILWIMMWMQKLLGSHHKMGMDTLIRRGKF